MFLSKPLFGLSAVWGNLIFFHEMNAFYSDELTLFHIFKETIFQTHYRIKLNLNNLSMTLPTHLLAVVVLASPYFAKH
jgi:hypothetical protein